MKFAQIGPISCIGCMFIRCMICSDYFSTDCLNILTRRLNVVLYTCIRNIAYNKDYMNKYLPYFNT